MVAKLLRRGNRAFTVASLLMILVAVGHTMGIANDPPDENWATAQDAMKAATVEAGPVEFTLYGVFVSVWIQVGALLAMIAMMNLIVMITAPDDALPELIRALSIFQAVAFGLLTVLFAVYQILPPLIAFALLTVAFLVPALRTKVHSH